MLNLPVPEAQYENVVLKPSEYQKEMVASLANRAEAVRNQLVSPYQDNMLRITNDGRKLALDQRLINEMLPANENSKVAVCAEKFLSYLGRNHFRKIYTAYFFVIYLRQGKIGMNLLAYMMS